LTRRKKKRKYQLGLTDFSAIEGGDDQCHADDHRRKAWEELPLREEEIRGTMVRCTALLAASKRTDRQYRGLDLTRGCEKGSGTLEEERVSTERGARASTIDKNTVSKRPNG